MNFQTNKADNVRKYLRGLTLSKLAILALSKCKGQLFCAWQEYLEEIY